MKTQIHFSSEVINSQGAQTLELSTFLFKFMYNKQLIHKELENLKHTSEEDKNKSL